jgi:hypothetical protein
MKLIGREASLGLVVLALLLLAAAPWARAQGGEGAVWDRVTYGMNEAQLRGLYPDLAASPTNAQSKEREVLPLESFYLYKRRFESLEPCTVDLTLYRGELARIQFYCVTHKPSEVRLVLEEKYGFPVERDPGSLVWEEGPTRITLSLQSGFFALGDAARAEEMVRSVLGQGLNRLQERKLQEQRPEASQPAKAPAEERKATEGNEGDSGASD